MNTGTRCTAPRSTLIAVKLTKPPHMQMAAGRCREVRQISADNAAFVAVSGAACVCIQARV